MLLSQRKGGFQGRQPLERGIVNSQEQASNFRERHPVVNWNHEFRLGKSYTSFETVMPLSITLCSTGCSFLASKVGSSSIPEGRRPAIVLKSTKSCQNLLIEKRVHRCKNVMEDLQVISLPNVWPIRFHRVEYHKS